MDVPSFLYWFGLRVRRRVTVNASNGRACCPVTLRGDQLMLARWQERSVRPTFVVGLLTGGLLVEDLFRLRRVATRFVERFVGDLFILGHVLAEPVVDCAVLGLLDLLIFAGHR